MEVLTTRESESTDCGEIVGEPSYTVDFVSESLMDECPPLPDLSSTTAENQVLSNDGAGPSSSHPSSSSASQSHKLRSRPKTAKFKSVFARQRGRVQKAAPIVKKSLISYLKRYDEQDWKLKEKELELKEKELNLREKELELKMMEAENERRKIELEETTFMSWNELNQATFSALIGIIGKKIGRHAEEDVLKEE